MGTPPTGPASLAPTHRRDILDMDRMTANGYNQPRSAGTKPRPSKHELRDIAEHLSDRCGFGSWNDGAYIAERIVALALGGETPTSIMRRLNPPARPDEITKQLEQTGEWE